MSLHQSNSSRAERASRAAKGRAALQRSAAVAFSCWLVSGAGCSFDRVPHKAGRSDSASEDWVPPTASSGGSRAGAGGAKAELDGSAPVASGSARTKDAGPRADAETPDAPAMLPMTMVSADAGTRDAAATAQAGSTASPAAAGADAPAPLMDASRPPEPPPRDAGMPQSRCRAGVYSGTFNGSMQLLGLALSTVTGTVRVELRSDADNEHLEMRDGRVMGVDQDGNRLTCTLSGTIDCDSYQLSGGRLDNGIFHNNESNTDTAFTGTAQAMYSQDPHSVVGNFSVEATDVTLLTGRGTWSLLLDD